MAHRGPLIAVAPRGFALAALLCACIEDPLGPGPGHITGPITGGTPSSDTETDSGETGSDGSDDCDPLADPLDSCGANRECDPATLRCVDAPGAGEVGDSCDSEDECAPGLACAEGSCWQLCDPELSSPSCPEARVCAHAPDPLPGLCRETCLLADPTCSLPAQACNRIVTFGGAPAAACSENPGQALESEACSVDADCAPGLLCTPADQHSQPCLGGNERCCAIICDPLTLPCLGLEPQCLPLALPEQESAGTCGTL